MGDLTQPRADRLVWVWEWGQDQHPVDRALALLAEAGLGSRDKVALLTVAARDRALLDLRALLFGPQMEFTSSCPTCDEAVEWSIAADALRFDPPEPGERRLTVGEAGEVRYRLPNSLDLVAAAHADSEVDGLSVLVRRCVIGLTEVEAMDSEVVGRLADAIREAMPQSDIVFNLLCPACEATWKSDLDLAGLLWAEVDVEVRRLMLDAAELAQRYGWSEQEILQMSPERRRLYLEMSG